MEGYGPYQIARQLKEQKIEIPAVHLARYNEGVNRTKPVKDPCGLSSSTIVHILKKREYLGHTVNFKTRKHFKDKKSHYYANFAYGLRTGILLMLEIFPIENRHPFAERK